MPYLACAVVLAVFFYLFLICPHMDKNPMRAPEYQVPYAHRGLHDAHIPENSLKAFQAALQAGYGIELDVRLSRDGFPVVIHDADLNRLCAASAKVQDMTWDQLKNLQLASSGEHIPSLQEVLDLVQGRVPLMIECKTPGKPFPVRLLPERIADALHDYRGPVCVSSFDPRILRWFKRLAPAIPRGQLAMQGKGMVRRFSGHLLGNFLSRPHFIAYRQGKRTTSFKIARLFHPVSVVWTIRSKAEWQAVQPYYDLMVFEAFLPPADRHIRPFQKEGNLP